MTEAQQLIALGAQEIDMVANYAWALSDDWAAVEEDSRDCDSTRATNVVLKVIIETAQLNTEHLQQFVNVCRRAGADYLKTSTGFNGAGHDLKQSAS